LTDPSHHSAAVTFRLSVGELSGVFEAASGKTHTFGAVAATLLEARLSPVQAMVALQIDIDSQTSAAEAYNLMTAWKDAQLVDAEGERIGTVMSEAQASLPEEVTDGQRHLRIQYAFTPPASYPEQVFIAPFGFNDADQYGADMAQAVPLTEPEEESK
ncbi:MAG TPA: hypothetical protein PKE04_02020, partial [Clostridia bacterium]|nr:hypothetical protein [Clostridia bacterium]